ncbi:MAG: AAA family ATPase, partial [Dysgonamonadaceae bacterium]|nr:AAA family ATPase [Dysgonamonadaceae bacterium]
MSNTDSHRPLPIGVEFFHDMIERGYYYIDKTLLIKDIIDNMAQVTLFTRPRRFGKTLNMTMLKSFFEDTSILHKTSYESENTRQLFDNLNIARAGEEYMSEQGKYPVIFLTLKSAKQPSFKSSFSALRTLIASEFSRHHYVFDSLSKKEKEMYDFLYSEKGSPDDYKTSLKFLSECLYKYHNKKVIIIIDEYDVPLETSYFTGFYQEMIAFIRSLFESALKTNIYLHFAVMTGCLRISKESIFTGLNNLNIVSILAKKYDEYFGFTQKEVDEMFKFYKLEDKLEEAKRWYNGYMFGNANVYNPWSIIKITDEWDTDKKTLPIAFWASTSSNAIVKSLIEKMDSEQNRQTKREIEQLISGNTIQKVIHEDITYDEIDNSID